MAFAKDRMEFNDYPNITFEDDEQNSLNILGKTGYYNPETMGIHVYANNRHPKDMLRSIAHELVHHKQNENGYFSIGGFTGAGYAQKNPHLRKMELEAFRDGNMCFRDWEDGIKEKTPTIYNEWRNNNMSTKEWKNKEEYPNLQIYFKILSHIRKFSILDFSSPNFSTPKG